MRVLVRKFENENRIDHLRKIIFQLILLLSLVLCSSQSFSQEKTMFTSNENFEARIGQNSLTLRDYKAYTKTVRTSIFVENNVIKRLELNPICLFTDIASVRSIARLIRNKESIEYVSIRIKNPSEVSNSIELSTFTSFPNLKFIHIIFEYEISNTEMQNLINRPSNNSHVIYESRKIM